MISKDQNKACLKVGEEALLNPDLREYGEYCIKREKGLRKSAFVHLDNFLKLAIFWEFEKKREFVRWLCNKMDTISNADYGPYPAPLSKKLFVPVFDEWVKQEPNNAEVYALKAQYTSDFDSYQISIEVDPNNQRARCALARQCIYDIWHSTHHLPEYFIGDEHEILQIVSEAEEHISHIQEGKRKENILEELRAEEQLLKDWIQFKSEKEGDFDQWCKAKGRQYEWIKAYYYE